MSASATACCRRMIDELRRDTAAPRPDALRAAFLSEYAVGVLLAPLGAEVVHRLGHDRRNRDNGVDARAGVNQRQRLALVVAVHRVQQVLG